MLPAARRETLASAHARRFLDAPSPRPLVPRAAKACARMEEKLVVDWRTGLLSRLLDDDVAGDFNLLHETLAEYRASPLFSLLKMLRLRMALQLQELVRNTCTAWRAMVAKASAVLADAVPSSKPLFTVELRVEVSEGSEDGSESGATANVALWPSEEDIMAQLLGPLEAVRRNAATVEVADHDLLALLDLPEAPILDLLDVVASLPGDEVDEFDEPVDLAVDFVGARWIESSRWI